MTDLNRIKKCLIEMDNIRNELKNPNQYIDANYEDMYLLYNIMTQQTAVRFIEGWIAHQISGAKYSSHLVTDEYKQNDNGDIWVGDNFKIGKNNIELKASFNSKTGIGGGQLRLYENVPWYIFFKAWDNKTHETFLLSKAQLVHEIKTRAIESNRTAFVSSQGSGVISKLNNKEKIERLDENVAGKLQDKIGWGFNPKTEKEYYASFKEKYQVQLSEVNSIVNKI